MWPSSGRGSEVVGGDAGLVTVVARSDSFGRMKIDAEKFLAMTVLLATAAGAPGCSKGAEKKADAKVEAKAVTPPAAPAAAPAAPVAPPAPAVAPVDPAAAGSAGAADSAGAAAGGAKAKPDPGPEEEKPSW